MLNNTYVIYIIYNIKYNMIYSTISLVPPLYNGCLPWYNVVLTSRVHLNVKYSQQSQLRTRATVE